MQHLEFVHEQVCRHHILSCPHQTKGKSKHSINYCNCRFTTMVTEVWDSHMMKHTTLIQNMTHWNTVQSINWSLQLLYKLASTFIFLKLPLRCQNVCPGSRSPRAVSFLCDVVDSVSATFQCTQTTNLGARCFNPRVLQTLWLYKRSHSKNPHARGICMQNICPNEDRLRTMV